MGRRCGEFTTTAAGADVQMTAPGSLVMMTMKSGGNDWSGMFHGDYEHESFVGENIDDALVLDVGSGGRLTLMADVYNALNPTR